MLATIGEWFWYETKNYSFKMLCNTVTGWLWHWNVFAAVQTEILHNKNMLASICWLFSIDWFCYLLCNPHMKLILWRVLLLLDRQGNDLKTSFTGALERSRWWTYFLLLISLFYYLLLCYNQTQATQQLVENYHFKWMEVPHWHHSFHIGSVAISSFPCWLQGGEAWERLMAP